MSTKIVILGVNRVARKLTEALLANKKYLSVYNVGPGQLILSNKQIIPKLNRVDILHKGFPSGIDVLVNLSFFDEHTFGAHRHQIQDYAWRVNILDTVWIADAVHQAKVSTFINMSTCDVYDHQNCDATEYSNISPLTVSTACVYAHDRELAARLPYGTKTRQVTIRHGIVLDNKAETVSRNMHQPHLKDHIPFVRWHQYIPVIHIDDLVNIYMFVIVNKYIHGVINAVNPNAFTVDELSTGRKCESQLDKAFQRVRSGVSWVHQLVPRDPGVRVLPYRLQGHQFKFSNNNLCHPDLVWVPHGAS